MKMRAFSALSRRLVGALKEDKAFSDTTTLQIRGSKTKIIKAKIIAKNEGIYCGSFLLGPLFRKLDPHLKILSKARDGQRLRKGQVIASLQGKARAILAGERVFLNMASRLSGIATLTQDYVRKVRPFSVEIFDTRKTGPLWRDLEKWAVVCGGGKNHRTSLNDAVLIKDNHLKLLRSLGLSVPEVYDTRKIKRLKKKGLRFVELEANSYREVWEGIKMRADVIMLDNMTLKEIKGSIIFIKAARKALGIKTPLIEISGGVTLKNIDKFAQLGVDRISIGALTHSAPSLDLSLEVI